MNGRGITRQKVETFRQEYLTGELARLPVDVFTLVELKLRLDVIPFDDLFAKYESEQAANEFAGRLLVPVERLQEFFDEFAGEFDTRFPRWRTHAATREMFADTVAPRFGVNSQVIAVRLDREGIWPAN